MGYKSSKLNNPHEKNSPISHESPLNQRGLLVWYYELFIRNLSSSSQKINVQTKEILQDDPWAAKTALGSDYRQKIEQTCFTASPIATNRSTILSVTSCGKAFAKDAINENP
jgi:hypothetical protein